MFITGESKGCSLIEYIARKTKNHRGKIVQSIGEAGIEKLLKDAEVRELIQIFCSFISDAISNFNSDLYYQNPNYLECCYKEGKILD